MKILDFQKWVFRIHVFLIAAIFILVVPTTQIVAAWYPGKTMMLWLVPVRTFAVSALLWLALAWAMPAFIRTGFFEDRRRTIRIESPSAHARLLKTAVPVGVVALQLGMLLVMGICLTVFLRGETLEQIFKNLP